MNKSTEINYNYYMTLLVMAIVFIFIGFGYGARYNEKQCNLYLLEDIYSLDLYECHDFCDNMSGAMYSYDGKTYEVFKGKTNELKQNFTFMVIE